MSTGKETLPLDSSKMDRFPCLIIASMVLMLVSFCTFSSSVGTDSQIFSYEHYCHGILNAKEGQQQGDPSTSKLSDFHLGFHRGFFSGGSPLFDKNSAVFSLRRPGNMAFFSTQNVTLAGQQEDEQYLVEGSLLLYNTTHPWLNINRTRVFRHGLGSGRDPFSQSAGVRLTLKGVWVAHSRILCMAGCFQQNLIGQMKNREDCQVKAIFHYPSRVTVSQPLVKGELESKREQSDPLFFKPVLVTAIPEEPYVFMKDDEMHSLCTLQHDDVPANINVWKDDTAVCHFPWYKQPLTVVWNRQCTGQDCSPFEKMVSASQATLSVQNMVCAEGKVHGYFVFSYKVKPVELQSEVFSVEGIWNTATGQLCASSCYLKGATNGSLVSESPDCDIIITLQFPTTLDLLFRYSVVGSVKRRQGSTSPSFKPFTFTGHMDITYGSLGWGRSPPQLEYSYTGEKIKQAQSKCQANSSGQLKKRRKGRRKSKYPDGHIFSDLSFQATLKDSSGASAGAYFSPIAINKRTNRYYYPSMAVVTATSPSKQKDRSLNISFDLSMDPTQMNTKLLHNTSFTRFSAEGVYSPKTGMLCLIACRTVELSAQNMAQLDGGDKDCQVLIKVQYPPTNPGFFEEHGISGQVVSLREQSDSLFFSPISLSSESLVYQEQAVNSLIQIDLEIIMGIISLTIAALFIALQLRHVKKNPKVLPQMSLLMLSALTLGHLIPLVLNFEAIFSSRSRQNVLQWSGGWLEINEVIVRLMTMLVFLLLVRLLHLAWVSKGEMSAGEGPWHMERGILRVCLTIYALGGLIALIVYGVRGSNFLDVTKAFAGLTVDFFLFPQMVGNFVWEVQGTVLSPPFYFGMTLVRSLPHLYDTVRKFEFFSLNSRRYYYANPSWDFYSNAWDAIIPCGSLLFAVLVFLQQRYGGACLSILFLRKRVSYEKVSSDPS